MTKEDYDKYVADLEEMSEDSQNDMRVIVTGIFNEWVGVAPVMKVEAYAENVRFAGSGVLWACTSSTK